MTELFAGVVLGGLVVWFVLARGRKPRPSGPAQSDVVMHGTAHAFRNLGAVLAGNVARARGATDGDEDVQVRGALDGIASAADQISELTWLLDVYAGQEQGRVSPMALSDLVERMLRVVNQVFPASFEVRFETDSAPDCHVDVSDANLMDVLLRVTLDAFSSAGSKAQVDVSLSTASNVATLSVMVSGTGGVRGFIPSEDLQIAVQRIGGHLVADKGNDQITRIALPVVRRSETAPIGNGAPAGGRRILVADDNRQVRALIVSMLEAHGFGTIQAGDGPETVERFQQHRSEIDYVVIDYDMPGIDGLQCATQIRALKPNVPVLLISGGTGQVSGVPDDLEVLRKPFGMDELTERVTNALFRRTKGT